ncbi:MAG: shikimate kinase [Clostridia bacterium]|nr:shikimate kinase [Clostridia bacterium]
MYGLLGRKLSHSLSPQIHAHFGSYPYELFCREPEELDEFFKDKTLKAYNVTIPYKIDAYNHCDELSETAEKIGSVNTVIRRPDGTLYGDNTDYFGFDFMSRSCGADYDGKKVLVLGSGGASLTVCAVAKDCGAKEIIVVSRSGENNYDNLHRHYDADIIVNTTPVGMYPHNGERLVDLRKFTNLCCVLDLIYNPCKTQLLLDAEELGIPCANGLKMLVAQGLRSAEQFPDVQLCNKDINDICNSMLKEQKNIVLIGMPGCGKSTVAKILSEKLQREALDTDEEIVKADGRTIPEIFSAEGEPYFRELETEAVKSVGKQLGRIIATGGGAVMKKENRDALGQNGTVIYLKKDLSLLSLDGRPLSKDEDAVKKIYEARKDTYEAFADFTVEVSPDAEITTERVIKCIF